MTVSPPERLTAFLPPDADVGNLWWVPAGSAEDVKTIVDGMQFDVEAITKTTSRYAGGSALQAASPFMREMVTARNAYWKALLEVRREWEAGGKVLSHEVAEGISLARDSLRTAIRAEYPFAGRTARAWETSRDKFNEWLFDKLPAAERTAQKRAAMLADGKYEELIASAFKSDAKANAGIFVTKTLEPVARYIGPVAIAVEIPYRAYLLDKAKTDKERTDALEKLLDADAVGVVMVACAIVGVGTGGVGLLACGVAEGLAGVFGGKAALYLKDKIH